MTSPSDLQEQPPPPQISLGPSLYRIPTHSPPQIDHLGLPHLFDAILEASSFSTLLAFRATSRAVRDQVDVLLVPPHVAVAQGGDVQGIRYVTKAEEKGLMVMGELSAAGTFRSGARHSTGTWTMDGANAFVGALTTPYRSLSIDQLDEPTIGPPPSPTAFVRHRIPRADWTSGRVALVPRILDLHTPPRSAGRLASCGDDGFDDGDTGCERGMHDVTQIRRLTRALTRLEVVRFVNYDCADPVTLEALRARTAVVLVDLLPQGLTGGEGDQRAASLGSPSDRAGHAPSHAPSPSLASSRSGDSPIPSPPRRGSPGGPLSRRGQSRSYIPTTFYTPPPPPPVPRPPEAFIPYYAHAHHLTLNLRYDPALDSLNRFARVRFALPIPPSLRTLTIMLTPVPGLTPPQDPRRARPTYRGGGALLVDQVCGIVAAALARMRPVNGTQAQRPGTVENGVGNGSTHPESSSLLGNGNPNSLTSRAGPSATLGSSSNETQARTSLGAPGTLTSEQDDGPASDLDSDSDNDNVGPPPPSLYTTHAPPGARIRDPVAVTLVDVESWNSGWYVNGAMAVPPWGVGRAVVFKLATTIQTELGRVWGVERAEAAALVREVRWPRGEYWGEVGAGWLETIV